MAVGLPHVANGVNDGNAVAASAAAAATAGVTTAPTTDDGVGGGGVGIARSPGSVVVPCRARGMPMDHNFRVSCVFAYFHVCIFAVIIPRTLSYLGLTFCFYPRNISFPLHAIIFSNE